MKLTINGEARELDDATTLAELLEAQAADTRGIAAAVDGEVVPRAEWAAFRLADGQAVEVLTAVQGG
jgi:sulfur carrier protein